MEGGPDCKSDICNNKTGKQLCGGSSCFKLKMCDKTAGHFIRTLAVFVFSFLTPVALFTSRVLSTLLHQASLLAEP